VRLRVAASSLCVFAAARAVTPVPAGALIQHPAHYFNLQHRRVRFRPRGPAAYDVATTRYGGAIRGGRPVGAPSDARGYSWRTPLPFPFAFAGKTWNVVTINLNGSLTFGGPEATSNPERDTWPDGTMRSQASTFDVHAIAGELPMIVPLWGLNSPASTRIFTRSTRGTFAVTWRAVRYQSINEGYAPLGESTFQAILARDGSIEFRYGDVAEKDGIAGVFPGHGGAGKLLDSVSLPPAANLAPEIDLRRAEVEDLGSDLRFLLTFAGPIPSKAAGSIRYGVAVLSGGEADVVRLTVDSAGVRSDPFCTAANPHGKYVGIDCAARSIAIAGGRTIEFYLPKIELKDGSKIEWKAEIARNDNPDPVSRTGELRPVSLDPAPGLTHARRAASANIYEVFHYPFLPKSHNLTFQEIYRHVPAEDDLAVALTDFRIDDIHNHGSSTSAGGEYGDPREEFNSPVLQQAAGPVYLGPRFRETIHEGGRTYRHFNFAVSWIAHEIVHRWVAVLHWKRENPNALLDTVQKWHWNPLLHTPVLTPVSRWFADPPYPEESIMGGMATEKLADGKVRSVIAPFGAVTGLCALDLYSMALIGPDEVPDTYFISGATPGKDGGLEGGDAIPVTIADILAANPPLPKPSPRRFRFEIYLLHESGRPPDPAALEQVRGIQAEVIRYFELAAGGRMTLVPPHQSRTAGPSK
jgi:hypothetical protein